MKRYREFTLLIIKSVSHSVLMYACFFEAAALLFNIYLSAVFFYTGALSSSISMTFYSLVNIKYKKRWNMTPSIFMGALYSAVLSSLYLFSGFDKIVVALCLLFNIYLWKLGWDTFDAGINYELYKEQFSRGFKILIALILISVISGKEPLLALISRFSIIYIIMGPIILKNSRDMEYVNTRSTKKAEMVNIITTVFIVLLMLFASSDMFVEYLIAAGKLSFTILDQLLTIPVTILGYIVGWFLMPLINWLIRHRKGNVLPEQNTANNTGQPDVVDSFTIPYNVQVAIKLIIFALVIFALIKLYNIYSSKRKQSDFIESREFVLDTEEVGQEIKSRLYSLFSKLSGRKKPDQTDLRGKVRYLYYSFLNLAIKRGNYKRIDETPREISINTEESLQETLSSLDDLTLTYQKVRYSPAEPSIEEYEAAEKNLKEVKEKLFNK